MVVALCGRKGLTVEEVDSVIDKKYGIGRGDWCSNVVKVPYGVGLWK